MKLENVRIPSGEIALSGLRYLPERNRRPIALIFAHGFTSGKYRMDSLAGYLAMRGYEGLSFDFVGHKLGGSGGSMQSARQAPENLRDALRWLRQHTEAERIVLVGHSMGAAATLQVAAEEGIRAERAGQKEEGTAEAGRQETSRPVPLAGIVCMCMGLEPARGFDSPIGQAMLAQRDDYVAGAPALQLLTEIGALVSAAQDLGPVPALFIAAKQDVLVPVDRVEALAALALNAEVERIESSHLDAPDRSRAPIYQWLSRLTTSQAS